MRYKSAFSRTPAVWYFMPYAKADHWPTSDGGGARGERRRRAGGGDFDAGAHLDRVLLGLVIVEALELGFMYGVGGAAAMDLGIGGERGVVPIFLAEVCCERLP